MKELYINCEEGNTKTPLEKVKVGDVTGAKRTIIADNDDESGDVHLEITDHHRTSHVWLSAEHAIRFANAIVEIARSAKKFKEERGED